MNRINYHYTIRIVVLFILVFVLSSLSLICVIAHERDEHDEDINYVLFGDKNYKTAHPSVESKIKAIEDAAYLCVDQFNGNGEDALEYLKSENIPNIPDSIAEIDYKSNYTHRTHTHRGWNMIYDKKVNWPMRQQILINTVDKEIFSSVRTPLSWVSEQVLGNNQYKKQCESFCVLLYCVHIIGDHVEAGADINGKPKDFVEKRKGINYIYQLTQPNDRDNPGIIIDLIKSSKILFQSQENSFLYSEYMQNLNNLKAESDRLVLSKGGINSEEKFNEYNECAVELLNTLAIYVPMLLKNEDYFKKSFFINNEY